MSETEMEYDIRAERERDRALMARTKSTGEPTWSPQKSVGYWACRNDRCRKPVQVYVDAQVQVVTFNKILRARMEPPINTAEIVFCATCEPYLAEERMKRQAARSTEVTKLIRELKAGPNWERADAIYAELKKLHHPDVKGLREAIETKSNSSKTTKSTTTRGRI